jgi:hypothetical protein
VTRFAAALLLAAVTAAPLPALAQSAPITATVDPTRRALGYELAQLLNSEAMIMALLDRMLIDTMPDALLQDSNVQRMEAEYPGIVKAMIEAMSPILKRYVIGMLPRIWDEVAVIYAGNLSEDDLRKVIAFYRSPTGVRVIELMLNDLDFGPGMTAMIQSGNFEGGEALVGDAIRVSANRLPGKLTPAQREDVVRFGLSPAGQRAFALTPRVEAVVAQITQDTPAGLEAELKAVVVAVIEKFTGRRLNP